MIVLPFPPSVNHYWRMVQGRMLISKAGRDYRTAVLALFAGSDADCWPTEPIAVSIMAWLPDKRRRDVDNMLKAPLDALAHAGVYADDSQIQFLSICKVAVDKTNPRLEIEVNAI